MNNRAFLRATAACAFAATASVAVASEDENPALAYRESMMTLIGHNFGPMQMTLEGKIPWDDARMAGYARDLAALATLNLMRGFPEGSGKGKTHAKPETKGRVVMLANGASRLELFEYAKPVPRPVDGPRPNADHGVAHFCFEVKEIEAEYERLRDAGVEFLSEPVPQAYVKVCYGRDPDGNLFELLEFMNA